MHAAAALEIKRVRENTRTHFWTDVEKLRSVNAGDLDLARYGDFGRYFMVTGAEAHIATYFESDRKGAIQFRKQFGEEQLQAVLYGESSHGWYVKGPRMPIDVKYNDRQMVAVFKV